MKSTINIGSVSLHEQVYNHYNMFMTFNVDIVRENCEFIACNFHCHHVTDGINDYVTR